MAVYKRGRVWWYKFTWNGVPIRESTKQTNKRVADQIEAAHKTALAKGEVGLRDRAPVPTLKDFAERDFLPFIESRFKNKLKTLEYYKNGIKNLIGFAPLASSKLDTITTGKIAAFITKRREAGLQVTSINRELEVLRRMQRLAMEWGKVEKALPKVEMLPGENQRDRVLTADEETRYLEATTVVGEAIEKAYWSALKGIRASARGEQPIRPADPFLLRDVVTVLLDCGMRPDECFRLRWGKRARRSSSRPVRKDDKRATHNPTHTAGCGVDRNAAYCRQRSLGFCGAHAKRSHGEIYVEETASEGVSAREGCSVLSVHVPAHMSYAMGGVHGPLHTGIFSGTQRFLNDAPVCSSASRNGPGSDGTGANWSG